VRAIRAMRHLISFARATSRSMRVRHVHRNETLRSAQRAAIMLSSSFATRTRAECGAVHTGWINIHRYSFGLVASPPLFWKCAREGGAFHGFRVEAPKLVRTAPKTR
jgi:hypothetical protein